MTRRALVWWGLAALAVAVGLGAAVSGALGFDATAVDVWWNDVMAQWRTPFLVGFAHIMNQVGGGWVATYLIPLGIAAVLLIVRRWRAAVFALAAFLFSAVLIQMLKHLFGRARPEDMLVLSDYGSFPSGHTANAATIAVVVCVLFPRAWTVLVGVLWVLAMALSRTLLSVHWLTDTIGGALVGAAAVVLLAAVLLPWVRQSGAALEPDVPLARLD